MVARSTHWGDSYRWLESVVKSCETDTQVDACYRLISNFEKLYQDRLGWLECSKLTRPLTNHLMNFWSDYITKKLNKK